MSDASTKTQEDSLQKTEPAPEGDSETPIAETPKAYTEADIQKAKAAVGAEWGRKLKAVEVERDSYRAQLATYESQIAETQKRIKDLEELVDRNEEEAAKTDPEAAAALRLKREGRQLRAQLEEERRNLSREKAQWQKDLEEAKAYAKERTAREIAEEHGVDYHDLVSLIPDGTREQWETLAKKLPKAVQRQETPKPDSLTGGGARTYEQLREAFISNPYDPKIAEAYLKARRERGLPG